MIRIGMVGLGKMGLSHLAIVRAHPDVQVVAACDSVAYLTDVLGKYTGLKCYSTMDEMLRHEALDAVVISTPSKLHAQMVSDALARGLFFFIEAKNSQELARGLHVRSGTGFRLFMA